jgi:hypothetical protein
MRIPALLKGSCSPASRSGRRTMPVRTCIRCAGLGRSPGLRTQEETLREIQQSLREGDGLAEGFHQLDDRSFVLSHLRLVSAGSAREIRDGSEYSVERPALSSRHPNNGRLRSNPRYSDDADSARRSRMLQRRPQRLQTNQTCPPTTEKCWTSVASQDGQRCSSRSCGRSGPIMVIAQGGTVAGPWLCYATHTSRLQDVPGGVGISLKSARARMARGLARAVLSVGTVLRWMDAQSVGFTIEPRPDLLGISADHWIEECRHRDLGHPRTAKRD